MRLIGGKWRNLVSNGLRPAKEGLTYPKIFLPQPLKPLVAALGVVDKNEAHVLAIRLPVHAVEFVDAPSSKLVPFEHTGVPMWNNRYAEPIW